MLRPGASLPDGLDTKIIFFAGAVAYWWFENWDTPQHWEYLEWRKAAEAACIGQGYLVYKHYDAFKGTWTDKATPINNFALMHSDAMVVLTEERIPSEGTDDEINTCEENSIPWIRVPSSLGVRQLILRLEDLFNEAPHAN